MSKYTFLLPGTPPEELLAEVYDLAGGYTVGEPVHGAYRMRDGTKALDRSVPVSVALPDQDAPALRQLLAKWAGRLGQETLYLEHTPEEVEFIRAA